MGEFVKPYNHPLLQKRRSPEPVDPFIKTPAKRWIDVRAQVDEQMFGVRIYSWRSGILTMIATSRRRRYAKPWPQPACSSRHTCFVIVAEHPDNFMEKLSKGPLNVSIGDRIFVLANTGKRLPKHIPGDIRLRKSEQLT
jgi:hypothetical protein